MGTFATLSPGSLVLCAAIGYLLGAIPNGMIVARIYRNVDMTRVGSGKTGATNVLRTLGPGAAVIVSVGDLLKGMAAVVAALLIAGSAPGATWYGLVAAVAATVGHSYSPFIGFRGGRGVLTGVGATFVVQPVLMLITAAVAFSLIGATRYVSFGSIGGALVGGGLTMWAGVANGDPALVLWGALVAGFIVLAHRDNMKRLASGTERKLGQRPTHG